MKSGTKRLMVIGLTLAILVVSGLLATGLKMSEDITALLPSSDPVVADYRLVVTRFKALESTVVDVGLPEGSSGTTADVIIAADAMAKALGESGVIDKVNYRIPPEQAARIYALLVGRRASLLADADWAEIERRLTPESIEQRLAGVKRALIEPSGPFVREHLRADPLGLNELVLNKLQTLNPTAGANVSDGRIWSEDSRHVLMFVTARSPAMDTARGEGVIAAMEAARKAALDSVKPGVVQISYIGGHRAALDNAQIIKADVHLSLTVTSVGILLLGLLVFRRKSFVVMMFFPAIFGMACSVICFALFSPIVSAVTLGCSALLIGISVDYGIHLLYRLDNESVDATTPSRCARSILLPLAAGACTTIGGLLCLVLVSLPGQQQVGLWAATGVLGASVFTVTALPFFVRSAVPARRPIICLSSLCGGFMSWRERHSKKFMLVALAGLVVGLIGLPRVRFEGDVSKMSFLRSDSLRSEQLIESVWGGMPTTSVVVRASNREKALEANDKLYRLLEEMREEGKIERFTSISPVLPAASTQQANRRQWDAFWSSRRREEVSEQVLRAAAKLGFAPDAFAPFHDQLTATDQSIKASDFDGLGIGALINSRIASGEAEQMVLSTINLDDVSSLDEVTERVGAVVPGAVVMNRRRFVEHTAGLVRSDVRTLALAAAVVMSVCLLLFLRRIELVLAVFLPVLFAFLVTVGLLGLLGIAINLISCLFVVFIFGVGIDYSIFLLNSALDDYRGKGTNQAVTFGAVTICAVSTLCGFAALSVAKHPALFSIGITGVIGMLSSLVAAVVVVPMIASALMPKQGRYGVPSLGKWLGGVGAFVYVTTAGLFYLTVLRPLVFLRLPSDIVARQRFTRRYLRTVMHLLLKCFPYLRSRRVYLGLEGNSLDKPGVIVANHTSAFDIFLMLSIPAEMVMMVKGWVWRFPVVGGVLRAAGYVPADDRGADSLLQRAMERLSQGAHVMVFPEGSRSPDGQMRRFHKGAFELAVRAQADIIPVLITNSQACIPWKSAWVDDHTVVLRVLPRVSPETFDYTRDSRELAQHVKAQMLSHQQADWQLAQEGSAFWLNIRSLYRYRGAFVESYVAWKLRLDPIFRHIDQFVPREGLIFDAGCGYGLMSNILARKSLQRKVVGVDIDLRKIGVAQSTALAVTNTRFTLGDLLEIQYPQAQTVLLVDVLHYWSPQKQRDIMARVCDALCPGGILVFRDAHESSGWRHRLTSWAERFAVTFGHNRRGDGLHFCTESFYLDELESHGLVLVDRPARLGRGSNVVLVMRKGM